MQLRIDGWKRYGSGTTMNVVHLTKSMEGLGLRNHETFMDGKRKKEEEEEEEEAK